MLGGRIVPVGRAAIVVSYCHRHPPDGPLLHPDRIAESDLTTLQLPVPQVDPLLDEIARRREAPATTVLEPAHVSLGCPWLPGPMAADRIDAVERALAGLSPVAVRLLGPHRFDADARGRVTTHLSPEPRDPVDDIARIVFAAARHEPDRFTPHCSLARQPAENPDDWIDRIVAQHLPMTVELDVVELRVRHRGTWRLARRMPLGG